jgi:hypothetical protein
MTISSPTKDVFDEKAVFTLAEEMDLLRASRHRPASLPGRIYFIFGM